MMFRTGDEFQRFAQRQAGAYAQAKSEIARADAYRAAVEWARLALVDARTNHPGMVTATDTQIGELAPMIASYLLGQA